MATPGHIGRRPAPGSMICGDKRRRRDRHAYLADRLDRRSCRRPSLCTSCLLHFVDRRARQDAAVDVGVHVLRQRVRRVPALDLVSARRSCASCRCSRGRSPTVARTAASSGGVCEISRACPRPFAATQLRFRLEVRARRLVELRSGNRRRRSSPGRRSGARSDRCASAASCVHRRRRHRAEVLVDLLAGLDLQLYGLPLSSSSPPAPSFSAKPRPAHPAWSRSASARR